MILPESLYRVANLAQNPPQLFLRTVITPFVVGGTTFQIGTWPRDRLFILQTLQLKFVVTTSGVASSLNSFNVSSGGVRLVDYDNLINNTFEPVVPDRSTRGAFTAIGSGGNFTFNLTPEVNGCFLTFGGDLLVTYQMTGVGTQVQLRADYSGFVVDRGGLIS